MTSRLEADVRKILAQGGKPTEYRSGLASLRGVSVEAVDAAIAAVGGAPRKVSAETVAQERLDEERRESAAWRTHEHEED